MTSTTLSSLVVILVTMTLAPVLSDLLGRWIIVPSVVLEIVGGVLVGPVLGWVHVDDIITFLSQIGLATLMFLAGFEIDLPRIRGAPLNRALAGWGISLVIGVAIGVALIPVDGARSGLIVGLAVTTTALGTLLPILRDSGALATDFGTHVLAGATVGEIGPIVAITVLLGTDRPARSLAVLMLFVVVVLGASALALRDRGDRLARLVETTLTTSGQLAIRIVVVLLGLMVWLAAELGLDTLLGAFAAGMVFHLFAAGGSAAEAELVEHKLQGLGFGFLIPVFFVVSGVNFDLDAIVDEPILLAVVPGFLLLFFLARGVPTALLQRGMPRGDRLALACYLATALPLVVVITTIGVETHRLKSGTAAALVAAALVSVLVYPLLAAGLRNRAPAPADGRR
jgi:Kef-type K+ transport system membrane component KefB